MALTAGLPKRAKRPAFDDFETPSISSTLANNLNLSSLNSNEREKLLEMLERESNVGREKLSFCLF